MIYSIEEIIKAYEILIKGIESYAIEEEDRAYGGVIRAGKGKLVESIAQHMVEIAWEKLNGDPEKLSFHKQTIKIPINKQYIEKIKDKEIQSYIYSNIDDYYYRLKSEINVLIDNNLVMVIECKAYTENAMLKRILVDFTLLRSVVNDLICVLVQLESQLTGDYSNPTNDIIYGSRPSHTLMSYFDVDLNIITLLEGERKVDEPIHDSDYYKELKRNSLIRASDRFKEKLSKFL
jgi:hypothetical protein